MKPGDAQSRQPEIPDSGGHINSIDCWCIPRIARVCPECEGAQGGCPACEFDEEGLANVPRAEYEDEAREFQVVTIHNSLR